MFRKPTDNELNPVVSCRKIPTTLSKENRRSGIVHNRRWKFLYL